MTEKEFNRHILPLADQVYSFARNMIGNPDDAADLTQDVMVRLWDKRHELKQVENPKAWTLKITRNLCLDWIRKTKPVYDEERLIRNSEDEPDPFRKIEERDAAEAVRHIIDTLPANQREVMVLRELEELEFKEIAQITGLEINNIRVLLSRGRTKVKEILARQYRLSAYE